MVSRSARRSIVVHAAEADGISKAFAGVQALKGVSFDLRTGEVHALVGENGAGKSTLIKVITGAPAGRGDDRDPWAIGSRTIDPVRARDLGIAAIYQQPALLPDLTVAENIALGLEPGGWWRRVRWGQRRERARRLLERIGASIDPEAEVRGLSMPEQQLVEIARALGADARIVIMDEPTASLSDQEVDRLFRVIGELKGQGVGIIYISHRLEELPQVADRVTALRDGVLVGTRPHGGGLPRRADPDDGRAGAVGGLPQDAGRARRRCVLEARGLGNRGVGRPGRGPERPGRRGPGPGRAGRRRPDRAGADPLRPDAGRRGRGPAPRQPVAVESPAQAVAMGIAYVPEDRRRHGVILEMATAANITLATLRAIPGSGSSTPARSGRPPRSSSDGSGSRPRRSRPRSGNLSGGNQQKVALARWLAARPAVLILDEPTQGVDVGAKAEIHRLMSELARDGLAILMISSELPEILGMSDRIAVMHGGTIVGDLDRAGATQEAILELALGHRCRNSSRRSRRPDPRSWTRRDLSEPLWPFDGAQNGISKE